MGDQEDESTACSGDTIKLTFEAATKTNGFGFWWTKTKDANTFLYTNRENLMFYNEIERPKGWGFGDQKDRNTVQEEIL